jgi:hypothetical protein
MDAFDDGIRRHDDVLAQCLQDRRIVVKVERAGVSRKGPTLALDQGVFSGFWFVTIVHY